MEILFAFIVLIFPTTPLWRLCTNSSFIRAFPYLAAALLLGLAAYLSLVISFLVLFPTWAVPVAILVVVAIALERWRARASYGASQGLPPGSLAILPTDVLLNDLALYKRAAQYGPVFKMIGTLRRAAMSPWFKPMICIVGIGRARELLSRHEGALESPELLFSRRIPRGFLRNMNKTDHPVYRSQFQAIISTEVVSANESFTIKQIQETLAAMSVETRGGIYPLPHLSKMVFKIWLRIFFGIAPQDPDARRVEELYKSINIEPLLIPAQGNVRKTLESMTTVLRAQAHSWESTPPPRCYLAEMLALNPNAFDDPTLTLNLIWGRYCNGR